MSKKIEKFEDFIAWQKARQLSRKIYPATNIPGFSRDFGSKDQIRRSAILMSNIAEGFERGRATEFHQFLSIAKASCAELRSQLYVAFDASYLSQAQFSKLMSTATEVGQVIGGLRVAVEKRKASA
ncbi:MAG: four helix bundle protein [Pyrinomonadaceae bacterium]